MASKPLSILGITYEHMDTLDLTGPLEVFTTARDMELESTETAAPGKAYYQITIAGPPITPVKSDCGLSISPDITYAEALKRIEDWDLIVVPGAWPTNITNHFGQQPENELMQLLGKFAKMPTKTAAGVERVLMSVCTGSLFFAELGLFAGRKGTTHKASAEVMQSILEKRGGEYVKASWVDTGLQRDGQGVRVCSSAGVSNGIDLALYVVEKQCGKKAAAVSADIMEYDGRRSGMVL